mgnify:CR=1 FL=1
MRTFNKINERTIEAVVGGAVVEMGPKAVLKYNDDMLTLFFMDKVFSYPNDAFAIKQINSEIGKYFYEKDAYVLDLPTRYEVYDDPKEYEDAKNEMAMRYVYNIVTERDLFEDADWDEENAEVSVRMAMFNDNESMLIRYYADEDKMSLVDDYGNEVVVSYDVEDEDYYLFQEVFLEGYKVLMALTVAYIIDNN